MNNTDFEYFRLLNLVLEKGKIKNNRTGIPTLGVFGAQARFNLQEGFPLLTTKRLFWRGIVHELLWFLSGSTNIKYLVDNDVHIWDEWAYQKFLKIRQGYDGLVSLEQGTTPVSDYRVYTQQEFVKAIKENYPMFKDNKPLNKGFGDIYGELGEGTYGGMWRAFPYYTTEDMDNWNKNPIYGDSIDTEIISFIKYVDQIQKLIDKLKTNPDDRRLIVSAWHPYYVDHCALPPCHCLFQFHTEELTQDERVQAFKLSHFDLTDGIDQNDPKNLELFNIPKRRLNCQLYQRSCDLFLGVPFNIASYALLTHMVAQSVGMVAGEFIHTFGDLHIYINHKDQVAEQLSREPKKLPRLILNPTVKSIFDFKYEDISIIGYDPHPTIKAEVAV